MTRRGRRESGEPLSEDEHDLWSHTAASVEPLKRAKGRFIGALAELAEFSPSFPRPVAETTGSYEQRHVHVAPHVPLQTAKKPPPLADFDRKKERRLRAGRIAIDARLDLHGMTLVEAHGALRSFLARCAGDGRRTVLVITGKGAPVRSEHPPVSHSDFMNGRERGVLRRHVPQWLGEPDLRGVVVSFTEAGPRHGGAGALYVHLRSA